MHVKTGDEVLILTGKDRGKTGKIKEAYPQAQRVLVEGVNLIKRHTKARGPGQPGGIIEREAPINASNVMLLCPHPNEDGPEKGKRHAARTGHQFLEETDHKGRQLKVRVCKVCGKVVDE